ncbi:MAG: DUF2059 domain-containing protein [Gammaproteobacteria bacterium]|nr:DUF2059 domain-containing protein [Gammaproteobacteria bacterium]
MPCSAPRRRVRLLLVAVMTVMLPFSVHADAAHEAAAEELLRLIQIDRGLAPMAARMRQSTLQQIRAQDVAVGEEPTAAPYLARIGDLIEATLSWERLRPDFLEIYMQTFTREELVTLNTFFRSSVGGKYLANVNSLNQQATEVVRRHAMATAPDVRAITDEMRAALDGN